MEASLIEEMVSEMDTSFRQESVWGKIHMISHQKNLDCLLEISLNIPNWKSTSYKPEVRFMVSELDVEDAKYSWSMSSQAGR